MILKIKTLNLAAGRPVAVLHKETAKKIGIHVNERIEIKCTGREKRIIAVVDLAKGILKEDEVAVSEEIVNEMKISKNERVVVEPSFKPLSTTYITKKIKKHSLNYTEIYSIISDIVRDKLTDVEIAYFCAAVGLNNMNLEEVVSLTKAMIKVGKEIKWKQKYILDKHCCSGVAGNRTTPLVVSIISSAIDYLRLDAIIPKTSSRAITSAAGTADDIEILTEVEFSIEKLKKIVEKTKACFIWNGILGLAPADDKIIQVEKLIQLESHEQIVASILAKKIAMGATHVVIDIPYGKSAKFNKKSAKQIKKLINKVASRFKLKTKCLLTNGNHPIGNGIGPVLEMRDVLAVLRRNEIRPLDLEEKSLFLASELLSFVISKKRAYEICKIMLYSGRAYEKFKEIIEAQGGSDKEGEISKKIELAKFSNVIKSDKTGKICGIDNKKIAFISRHLGCPADKQAGIYLNKKIGNFVHLGDSLFTIYAENKEKLEYTASILKHMWPFEVR